MKAITLLMPFISILFADSSDVYGPIVALILIAFFLYLYFIPSVIAYKNNKNNKFIILLINLFFGGTGLGWLVALALALNKD